MKDEALTGYHPAMSWDHLSELSEHYVVYAYCAGNDGAPPCGYSAKLDLAALIEQHGDILHR